MKGGPQPGSLGLLRSRYTQCSGAQHRQETRLRGPGLLGWLLSTAALNTWGVHVLACGINVRSGHRFLCPGQKDSEVTDMCRRENVNVAYL